MTLCAMAIHELYYVTLVKTHALLLSHVQVVFKTPEGRRSTTKPYLMELEVLQLAMTRRCSHIISCYGPGVLTKELNPCIIMERGYKTLSQLVGTPEFSGAGEQQQGLRLEVLKQVMFEMGLGLYELHKLGYIHRDVKPGNAVLVKNTSSSNSKGSSSEIGSSSSRVSCSGPMYDGDLEERSSSSSRMVSGAHIDATTNSSSSSYSINASSSSSYETSDTDSISSSSKTTTSTTSATTSSRSSTVKLIDLGSCKRLSSISPGRGLTARCSAQYAASGLPPGYPSQTPNKHPDKNPPPGQGITARCSAEYAAPELILPELRPGLCREGAPKIDSWGWGATLLFLASKRAPWGHCGGDVVERLRGVEGRGVGEVLGRYPVCVGSTSIGAAGSGSDAQSGDGSGGGATGRGGVISGSHSSGSGGKVGSGSSSGSAAAESISSCAGQQEQEEVPEGFMLLSEVLGGPEGLEVLSKALAWHWEERMGMEELLGLPWFRKQREQLMQRFSGVGGMAGATPVLEEGKEPPLVNLVRKWRQLEERCQS